MLLKRKAIAIISAILLAIGIASICGVQSAVANGAAPTPPSISSAQSTVGAGGTIDVTATQTLDAKPTSSYSISIDSNGISGISKVVPDVKDITNGGVSVAEHGDFTYSDGVLTFTFDEDYITGDLAAEEEWNGLYQMTASFSVSDSYADLIADATPNGGTYTLGSFTASANVDGIATATSNSNRVSTAAPSLSFTKTANKLITNVGEPVTYTLTVTLTNNTQVFGMKVTDTLNNQSKLAESVVGNSLRVYSGSVSSSNDVTNQYNVSISNGVITITPKNATAVQLNGANSKLTIQYVNTYNGFDLVGGVTFGNSFTVDGISGSSIINTTNGDDVDVEVGIPTLSTSVELDKTTNVNSGSVVSGTAHVGVNADNGITTQNAVLTVSLNGTALSDSGIVLDTGDTTAASNALSFTINLGTLGNGASKDYRFTIALPTGTKLNGQTISVNTVVTADNARSANASKSFSVSDPKLEISTTTTQPPLSAESEVKVQTVVNETVDGAEAQHARVTITDTASEHGATAFTDVQVVKQSNGDAVAFTSNTDSGALVIDLNDPLTFNDAIVITYSDILAAGYENNDATIDINATIGGGNDSNILGTRNATASYKINPPVLALQQDVVMPVITVDPETGTTGEATENDGSSDNTGAVNGDNAGTDTQATANGDASGGNGAVTGGDGENTDVDVDTGLLPNQQKNLVINPGDTVDFTIKMDQTSAEAIARDVTLDISLDKASADAGATIVPDSIVITDAAGTDVSSSFAISSALDDTSVKISGNDDQHLDWVGVTTYNVAYTVKAGDTDTVELRGSDITLSATLSASNAAPENYATDDDAFTVASSVLEITKSMDITEVKQGDTVNYVISVKNTGEMKEAEAMDIVVSDILSQTIYDMGYRIDAKSYKVTAANGDDVTSDADISWATPSSAMIDTHQNLKAGEELTIEYTATTANVSPDAYSANIFNTAVASADNATYQVAIASGMYYGADLIEPAMAEGGSIPGSSADSPLAQTGDGIKIFIAIGIAIVAVAAVGGVIAYRRYRNNK